MLFPRCSMKGNSVLCSRQESLSELQPKMHGVPSLYVQYLPHHSCFQQQLELAESSCVHLRSCCWLGEAENGVSMHLHKHCSDSPHWGSSLAWRDHLVLITGLELCISFFRPSPFFAQFPMLSVNNQSCNIVTTVCIWKALINTKEQTSITTESKLSKTSVTRQKETQ